MKTTTLKDERPEGDASNLEPVSGQPIEEAEKNLSRHATRDSSPSIQEQERTSVRVEVERDE
ncbi:MAG TPA: hypothetical protein VJT09_08590 [Pyrinomonadaceae bacterium]|nr:hypothetical protein [Pyrinomonadaceae bacterium]